MSVDNNNKVIFHFSEQARQGHGRSWYQSFWSTHFIGRWGSAFNFISIFHGMNLARLGQSVQQGWSLAALPCVISSADPFSVQRTGWTQQREVTASRAPAGADNACQTSPSTRSCHSGEETMRRGPLTNKAAVSLTYWRRKLQPLPFHKDLSPSRKFTRNHEKEQIDFRTFNRMHPTTITGNV